ncbi:MAG TPA: FGGY-family carbohydrate kinase [Ilumatobacteraceae bacterium]
MPHEDGWYLAIDLGTGGTKVAAVDGWGNVRASAFASIQTTITPDGGATQDTDQWWLGIVQSVRALVNGTSASTVPDKCLGVGITGQWGSTVPVDGDGRAIGPCLLWSDDRGGALSSDLVGGAVRVSGYGPRKLATWIRRAGGAPSPAGADPTGHALHLRVNDPERYAAARSLLEPIDFIGACLTGRIAATPASMVLSWLTDNRRGASASAVYDPELVRLSGRDPALLPPLHPTGSVLGPLTEAAAAELELPVGLPVVGGVPDLHTAYLGSGALADYEGHLSISTTAWVSAAVPFKKTDVLRQMASIPGIRPGSYLIANNHETGGATLRWFREAMYGGDDGPGSPPSYDEITEAAAAVPPGAGGVLFTPWLKGERSPVDDRTLRGSFLNLSLSTDRAALSRAVLEGVAFNAAWLLEATEKFAGRPLHGLRILGGGAQSDLWCQIHADVVGRPIGRTADPMHVNVRGAAWFAALALGHLTMDDVARRAPAVSTFSPDPPAARVYAPMYQEFRRIYRQQKAMYRRLNGRPGH